MTKSPLNDNPDIVLRYSDGTEHNIVDLDKPEYEEFLELVRRINSAYQATIQAKDNQ